MSRNRPRKGCTLKGVCGKTAEVAGLQDLLMYLMKGISKLTTTLRKQGVESSTANKFIVDGLFMTITNANFDSSRFVSKIKEAYQLRENLLNELHRLGIHLSLTCDCLTWKSDKVEEMEVKAKEVGILPQKTRISVLYANYSLMGLKVWPPTWSTLTT